MNATRYLLTALAITGIAATSALASAERSPTWRYTAQATEGRLTCMEGMGRMPMMHSMQVSSEFEYLSQMIPHHQEAIATARLVLEGSDRPEMQSFAQDIITTQSAEIEQMEAWLAEWYPNQQSAAVYEPMMRDLEGLQGDALDQAFLEDMIMHHRGAVMMSQMLIHHNLVEHEAVQPFATQIATTQRAEIHQMHGWLQDWFADAGQPSMMPGHGMRGMHGGPEGMGGQR